MQRNAMAGTQATAADSSGCSCTKSDCLFLFDGLAVAAALCLETELDRTSLEQAQKKQTLVTISCCWSGYWWYSKPNSTLDTITLAHLSPEVPLSVTNYSKLWV